MQKLVGRKTEVAILETAFSSNEAEMVSIIGRRRVGKTFLVRSVFDGRIDFELSGIQNAATAEQLRAFSQQLKAAAPHFLIPRPPKDWLDAFFMLIEFLENSPKNERLVVFFDEVPWLAAGQSGFLKGLSHFWNSWASKKNVLVILCGSAASWMTQKILRDKGGLHNRVTRRIRVRPFSLAQTEAFLASRGLALDRYDLTVLFMAMGGVPHYLKEIEGQKSAAQHIERICFSDGGLLRDEFSNLYAALFDHPDYHMAVVRALAAKHYGMTRKDLVEALPYNDSGRISRVLEELIESDFVAEHAPFGKKKKEKVFRLADEYSMFYLRFIEPNRSERGRVWDKLSQTPAFRAWSGYAFENVVLKHADQIKKALGISGVLTSVSAFVKTAKNGEEGLQIDLLIDRADRIIDLVEIKFFDSIWSITKAEAERFREKTRIFKAATGTRKTVRWVAVSPFGTALNAHRLATVAESIELDALFEP